MLSNNLMPWLLLLLALAVGAAGTMYHLWDEADERADRYEDLFVKQRVIAKITKEYVHDIQYKPVPDSVIASRAQQLCEQLLRKDRPDGDGAASSDSDHREDRDGEGFYIELKYCWQNTRQLRACQDEARAAGCAD